MPKSPKENISSPVASENELMIYIYDNQRIMARRRDTLKAAVLGCKHFFPSLAKSHKITFHTSDLDLCDGQLTEISPEIWGDVMPKLKRIIVRCEDINEDTALLGTVSSQPASVGYRDSEAFNLDFYYNGQNIRLRLTNQTRAKKALTKAATALGIDAESVKFYYDGARLSQEGRVADWSIKRGLDEVQCQLS